MNRQSIIDIQKNLFDRGLYRGEVDGFFGPKSIAALQGYLSSLMPTPNPWPKTSQAALQAFYGSPGDESQLVTIEFPFPMFYEGKQVYRTRVHRKCAESLLRVLKELAKYGPFSPVRLVAQQYSGCFNNRLMRNGSVPSLHSRGAAIDLDAEHNGNLAHWPDACTMPLEIMEAFAREGWVSAGAFWGRDAMHFQATRV